MLLEPLVLQHFQKQCCQQDWFYNISKNTVARSIGFTTFPKNNDARTIGFTTFPKITCLKKVILQI